MWGLPNKDIHQVLSKIVDDDPAIVLDFCCVLEDADVFGSRGVINDLLDAFKAEADVIVAKPRYR